MAKAYFSTVLNQPAEAVWALVRDFNDYPRYIDGVDQSVTEDTRSGDSVGAVRRFRYGGEWIRQRLVALSDADRSFTYTGLAPFRFPSTDGATNPAHTDRLRRDPSRRSGRRWKPGLCRVVVEV